jgi:hypothetical protein
MTKKKSQYRTEQNNRNNENNYQEAGGSKDSSFSLTSAPPPFPLLLLLPCEYAKVIYRAYEIPPFFFFLPLLLSLMLRCCHGDLCGGLLSIFGTEKGTRQHRGVTDELKKKKTSSPHHTENT